MISFGTDLVNPDFARLAEACGIFGRNVEDPESLRRFFVPRWNIRVRHW